MKKQFISFLNKPKLVASISLMIALVLGVYGYFYFNKKISYQFTTVTSGTISEDGNTSISNVSLGFLSGGRIKSVSVKAGDIVSQGQELASLDAGNTLGVLTQAKAGYDQAEANYQKLINGATGPAIDVAKVAVNSAQANLDEATKQQNILVANAKRALLNSTITAQTSIENNSAGPTISGTYTKDTEGTITIKTYSAGDGQYFTLSGIATGNDKVSSTIPKPLGDTGLSILFPSTLSTDGTWTITIPNTTASNYLTNYNAYQAALQTKTQTLTSLQSILTQAQASLDNLITAARPEDISSAKAQIEAAKGSIQIAQAAYDNTIIKAPYDGVVKTVSISVNQIAVANAPAIELSVKSTLKNVEMLIPESAIIYSDGKNFVFRKENGSVVKTAVITGIRDAKNVEIISGLSVGDQVVIY